jgi:ketosteroid isomerase-like protein
MSEENVEILRRALEAWNAADLDAILELYDPEIELDWSRSRGLEAGIYRGRQAVRGFWSSLFETFDRVAVFPHEFIESGEHVVVPNRARFWGRDGVVVEAENVLVWTLRHGRIIRHRLYQERAEALEAVGLSDQDAHPDS